MTKYNTKVFDPLKQSHGLEGKKTCEDFEKKGV